MSNLHRSPAGILGLLAVFLAVASPAFALPPRPVISEVIVDVSGPESDSELVELYNPTGEVLNIGGWDIGYKTASGATWAAASTIPAGETIPAYGYYLIGGDKVTPAPDYVDTSLGFASAGGHIAIRDNQNNIIDKLGYGTANDPEGAAPPAPGTNDSLERLPGENDPIRGNGQDSENNLADFLLRMMPEPQNSESAIEWPPYDTGGLILDRSVFATLAETCNITVYDSDLNNRSTAAETFTIRISSLADPVGIALILTEAGLDSGGFDLLSTGKSLGLTLGASVADSGLIKVRAAGDTVTVTYCDSAPFQTVSTQAGFNGLLQIKINEVMFDPSGADQGNEWVELFNAGVAAVEITGWTLTDEDASVVMEMPVLTVPAGMWVVWYVDKAGTNETDFADSVAHIYSDTATTVSLTNTEDQVSLYASTTRTAATIVDFVAWLGDAYYDNPEDDDNAVAAGIWPSNAIVNTTSYAEGSSLCLKPDGDDQNLPTDWEEDHTPTEGGSNTAITPPSAPTDLLAVAGNSIVSLSWTAAAAGDLPVAGYNVYRRIYSGSYGAPLNDTTLAATEYQDTTVVNGTAYYYVARAVDEGNNSSGNSNEVTATPSAPLPPGNHLVINEVCYDPSGAEPEYEWVELHNPTDTAISIAGWTFTDGEGIFVIPDSTVVWERGYLVLGNTINAAGGKVDLIYGPYDTGTISFQNTADNVILKDTQSVIVDEVDYQAAWGGAAPKTLSRKYAGADANEYTNWGKSQASGGTPQAVNDVDTVAPVITHTPITRAVAGCDIGIHTEIEDNLDKTLSPGQAKLYYRNFGDTAYTSTVMSRITDTLFDGLIPGEVTDTTLEYFLRAEDSDNNNGYHGDDTNPHLVEVTETPFRVIINELMYDPADTEPALEWVELYNADTEAVNLGGWTFTDGEDAFIFDTTLVIAADSYLVLGKTAAAAGGKVNVVYGDAAPGIQFVNILATITDQVILKDTSGLIVDEVNYSSNWGANNISGPNNTTLERLNSDQTLSNEQSSWAYSMDQNGSAGERNSPHYVWNVAITPSQFNPLGSETATISYYQSESGTATIKVYDDSHTLLKTLVDGIHRDADTYEVIWDGKDSGDTWVLDICMVEFEVVDDSEGRTCLHHINDATFLGVNDQWDQANVFTYDYQFSTVMFWMVKPGYVTVTISDQGPGGQVYSVPVNQVPCGAGPYCFRWDARDEKGLFYKADIGWSFLTQDILGNVVITKFPLELSEVTISPTDSFNPDNSENEAITFSLTREATVSTRIYNPDGTLIRTLLVDVVSGEGSHTIQWDGKNESNQVVDNGTYTVTVEATDGLNVIRVSAEIVVNTL